MDDHPATPQVVEVHQRRRPDYQAQTGQAAGVWPRQARPARSTTDRCRMIAKLSAKLRHSLFWKSIDSRTPARDERSQTELRVSYYFCQDF